MTIVNKDDPNILRHEPVERPPSQYPAAGVEGAVDAVIAHMETHFGPVAGVFHEIVSDAIHLDVHIIAPSDEKPYHVAFTTGMAALPMTVPDASLPARAELMLALPREWQVGNEAFRDQRWYWPIAQLKWLARLPHDYGTWLAYLHTVPNDDPPVSYAPGVPYCCSLIVPPTLLPEGAHVVPLSNGEQLQLLAPVFIHPEEMALKLRRGVDALLRRLDRGTASELVDLERPDASRRWRLWPRR